MRRLRSVTVMAGPFEILLAMLCAATLLHVVRLDALRAQTPPGLGTGTITISIVGTNDLHGRIFTDRNGRGGLPVLGGFIENLRAARAADGGGVLLLDAGDTFQGGIESNLSEGEVVVDAYNAMGYTGLAVGNHDFDYGDVDPRSGVGPWLREQMRGVEPADMRGALKAAARRARFPFLAANIVDESTGKPLAWPNVSPSALVEVAGVRVGLVGVMTASGLRQTLQAHAVGLTTTPLVPTIQREADALRARGAELVVLVAHEGGYCGDMSDPRDVSSCDDQSEIFDVARRLPRGTLQAVVAGHTHQTVAHIVNDVGIIEVPDLGGFFGRMDLEFDTAARRVTATRVHRPRAICTREDAKTHACVAEPGGVAVEYEGRPVARSARVEAAMAPSLARVQALRDEPLGAVAETPVGRSSGAESALGNLFADALRAMMPGADVALSYGPGRGGLRTDLPAGPLTFGAVYDVFPFDNRVVRVSVTGAQLTRVLRDQLPQLLDGRRGLLSISGLAATVSCEAGVPRLDLRRPGGAPIGTNERVVVAAAAYSAGRAAWSAVEGEPGVEAAEVPILVRDAVAAWIGQRGGRLRAADFVDADHPRWTLPPEGPSCRPPAQSTQ